jgi:hypothetical protein
VAAPPGSGRSRASSIVPISRARAGGASPPRVGASSHRWTLLGVTTCFARRGRVKFSPNRSAGATNARRDKRSKTWQEKLNDDKGCKMMIRGNERKPQQRYPKEATEHPSVLMGPSHDLPGPQMQDVIREARRDKRSKTSETCETCENFVIRWFHWFLSLLPPSPFGLLRFLMNLMV